MHPPRTLQKGVFRIQKSYAEYGKEGNYHGNRFSIRTFGAETGVAGEKVKVFLYGYVIHKKSDHQQIRIGPGEIEALYLENGRAFVAEIKGSFCIFIADERDQSYHFITDQLNSRLVYYSQTPDAFVLSSSLSALAMTLYSGQQTIKINQGAVLQKFLFNFTLNSETLLENISTLSPGNCYSFEGSKRTKREFFNTFNDLQLSGPVYSKSDGANHLIEILRTNINLGNDGPQNTAVPLTGGLDSRVILALLQDASDYQYYSYGQLFSYDITIARKVAKAMQLKYEPIDLAGEFTSDFARYAHSANLLSEGEGSFKNANFSYVYSQYYQQHSSLISGIFGSELIKNPTSTGLFLNADINKMLSHNNNNDHIKSIIEGLKTKINLSISASDAWDYLANVWQSTTVLNNNEPYPQKLFHYFIQTGIRKYFAKEIKIARLWKTIYHPFFDIDFIIALLKTPFPWVYNYNAKKNLIKNVQIHAVYALILREDKKLLQLMTTHGYKPAHLLHPIFYPILALRFFQHKKTMMRHSKIDFMDLYRANTRGLQSKGSKLAFLLNDNAPIADIEKLHSIEHFLFHLEQGLVP
jgi:hypothetical protein